MTSLARQPVLLLGFTGLVLALLCCRTPESADPKRESQGQAGSNGTGAHRLRSDPPADLSARERGELAARAKALVTLALGRGQAYQMLTELCTTAPKRLAGTEDAERAVAWGERTMRRLGLANVRREPIMVPRWVRGPTERLSLVHASVVNDDSSDTTFDITALGGSIGTPEGGIRGEVVMVRNPAQLKQLGLEVGGKIVFFNRPMSPTFLNTFMAYGNAVGQRSSGPIHTARYGGVATIVRSMTTLINDYPHTGATRYQDGIPKVPAAAISTRDAERLARLLQHGPVELKLELSCKTLADVPSANVVGEIVGSEKPDEIVLIGGHLDSWDIGQGAHDDGAGIVHCLEAMRLITAAGIRPRRTIRCVLYMNEENGIRGATGYVDRHRKSLEAGSHFAAIESDRGGFRPLGFDCSARGAWLQRMKLLAEPLRQYNMGAMIKGGRGGVDIAQLAPFGPLLFGLVPESQRYFDYHHSDLDRIEAVNERELALGAAAVAYLASVLADE